MFQGRGRQWFSVVDQKEFQKVLAFYSVSNDPNIVWVMAQNLGQLGQSRINIEGRQMTELEGRSLYVAFSLSTCERMSTVDRRIDGCELCVSKTASATTQTSRRVGDILARYNRSDGLANDPSIYGDDWNGCPFAGLVKIRACPQQWLASGKVIHWCLTRRIWTPPQTPESGFPSISRTSLLTH